MADVILGGIEGGATHSKIVLYNGLGKQLVQCGGPGTNHWMLGMEECQKRLCQMVEQAKKEAGLSLETPIAALGMSLSGCEQDETNQQLKDGLLEKYPNLSSSYVVCSDTVGSVAAAMDNGGIVLIAGTGSNALLINPDGSQGRCGGWGHMLGDEGGAWWISHKAVKVCFDEQDNFREPPHPTEVVWSTIKRYFGVESRFDLLDHCYSSFEKSTFAGLSLLLAEQAQLGDPLCQWLFSETGKVLARHIIALHPKADKGLLEQPGGLSVVCVGAVWRSWDFLKPGFTSQLAGSCVEHLTLLRLTTSMATGATYLAAKHIGFDLPRNYQDNYKVFFEYHAED